MQGKEASFVKRFKHTLSQTERYVLSLRYSDELTPREIGLVLDMSTSTIDHVLLDLRERARSTVRADLIFSPRN
jgi:DNA-directed RNA polymerase specialized sigma subunit